MSKRFSENELLRCIFILAAVCGILLCIESTVRYENKVQLQREHDRSVRLVKLEVYHLVGELGLSGKEASSVVEDLLWKTSTIVVLAFETRSQSRTTYEDFTTPVGSV